MSEFNFLLLIAIVAFLYSSVGHGGASGYLALMVIFSISPGMMKQSALMLNLFVSSIAFYQYYKQGFFRWKILFPFIILSIPLSFIGAGIHLDTHTYKIILAVCLFIAILRLLGVFGKLNSEVKENINFFPALLIGGVIGLISGMIGIGGGILLSPVLLLFHWANMKEAAATSAIFIFLNSIAGLIGASGNEAFSIVTFPWLIAAIVGGIAGSYYGSSRFNYVVLKYILSSVLLFACFKLIIA